jgi:ammonium transporter, Amt family
MIITFGFAGGFTGGWFASKGDPFWTLSGGLAGVISVSAGADVYHPSLGYLLATSGGMVAVWSGRWIERKLRVDDAVGAVAVHGVCGFYGVFLVGIFAGGFPTGLNNVESSFGGQLIGMLTFFPLAFLPGYIASWILKYFNLLRVPPEVELEGLDMAEFQADFFPEFERVPETIVLPTGEEVEAAPVLLDAFSQVNGHRPGVGIREERRMR